MGGRKDLAESKAKILAYKLGNPRTYVPNPKRNFPVVSRFVDPVTPKPRQTSFFDWKPAEPKVVQTPAPTPVRRSTVKTVRKGRAVQATITVKVCECGTPISARAKQCAPCSVKYRTGNSTVCPKCKGTKHRQAKHCMDCAERKPRSMDRYTCPQCGGTKAKGSKLCNPCRYPKTTCACGAEAKVKGMCRRCHAREYRRTHGEHINAQRKTGTCIDCGKAITKGSTRCGHCSQVAWQA